MVNLEIRKAGSSQVRNSRSNHLLELANSAKQTKGQNSCIVHIYIQYIHHNYMLGSHGLSAEGPPGARRDPRLLVHAKLAGKVFVNFTCRVLERA